MIHSLLTALYPKQQRIMLQADLMIYPFEVNKENAPDYERLEFLGDSVLRLVISNYLYDKYKEYDEGN